MKPLKNKPLIRIPILLLIILLGISMSGSGYARPFVPLMAEILPENRLPEAAGQLDNSPRVISLSPGNTTINAPVDANLVIVFDRTILMGTGNIIVTVNGVSQNINVNFLTTSVVRNTAIIQYPGNFPLGAEVSVVVPMGAFIDLEANRFVGIAEGDWRFTVVPPPDIDPPMLVSFAPEKDAGNVKADARLELTFSEPVKKGTGRIIIYQSGTNQTIDVGSDAVTITADSIVTIDPPEDFPSGVKVSIVMPAGIFTDWAGNHFAGIDDASFWTFSVEDYIPPTVTSLFPPDDAVDIAANVNLVMTFSEKIKKGTGKITIHQGNTTQEIDVASDNVIVSDATAIINAPEEFPLNTNIHVRMPAGVFTDLAGNPYGGINDATTWNMKVAPFVDNTRPVVLFLSPATNATDVAANTNLVLAFSEPVKKGTGAISVHHGEVVQTIDVKNPAVSISGNTVTVNPPEDFPLGARVHIQVSSRAFSDLAGNYFEGIADADTWAFTVSTIAPVRINAQVFPEYINSNASGIDASIEVSELPANTRVEFVSKGIAQTGWSRRLITSPSLKFTATLARPQFDEIGMEYYFDITFVSGAKIASDTGHTYIQYVGEGMDFPELKAGNSVDSYQMISIPLDLSQKDVATVLEDNLGPYDVKKWRLFNFQGELLQEYLNGFTSIETGRAYWLIMRNPANVTTGEGRTVRARRNSPYTLQLRRGWNQVGNPYNFNLSWNDIKEHNQNPEGLGNLRVFDGSVQESDILQRFGGGFVFAEEDMAVNVPVLKNTAINGRLSAITEKRYHDGSAWEVNFTVKGKDMQYNLGGLGMHPDAKPGKDPLDDITVPRFLKYLEINFHHPEYFAPNFTKDMVPVAENYQWEFTVESNAGAQTAELSWENYLPEALAPGKQLLLFDVQQSKLINLLGASRHSFPLETSATFRVFYGDAAYIAAVFESGHSALHANFPNPFSQETTIPFVLAATQPEYHVRMNIYDMNGRQITTLVDGQYPPGAHQVRWNRQNPAGQHLPPGMYICRMEVYTNASREVFVNKLLVK